MKNFESKFTFDKTSKKLTFNEEAIEALELDMGQSRILNFGIVRDDKVKEPFEIYIVKINGSMLDSEDVAESVTVYNAAGEEIPFPKDAILIVANTEEGAVVTATDRFFEHLSKVPTIGDEYKIIPCYSEHAVLKSMRDTFSLTETIFKVVSVDSKKDSVGTAKKNVEVSQVMEERVSLTTKTTKVEPTKVDKVEVVDPFLEVPFPITETIIEDDDDEEDDN